MDHSSGLHVWISVSTLCAVVAVEISKRNWLKDFAKAPIDLFQTRICLPFSHRTTTTTTTKKERSDRITFRPAFFNTCKLFFVITFRANLYQTPASKPFLKFFKFIFVFICRHLWKECCGCSCVFVHHRPHLSSTVPLVVADVVLLLPAGSPLPRRS